MRNSLRDSFEWQYMDLYYSSIHQGYRLAECSMPVYPLLCWGFQRELRIRSGSASVSLEGIFVQLFSRVPMPAKVQYHNACVNTTNRVFLKPPQLLLQKYTHKKAASFSRSSLIAATGLHLPPKKRRCIKRYLCP